MKETLLCTRCDKKWKRDKVRGRKPHYCLPCAQEVALTLENTKPAFSLKKIIVNKEQPKILVSTAKPKTAADKTWIEAPSHWQCSTCLVYIGVEIKINEPPMHRCAKRAMRAYALERINKKPPKSK
jgi:hypothetical protein